MGMFDSETGYSALGSMLDSQALSAAINNRRQKSVEDMFAAGVPLEYQSPNTGNGTAITGPGTTSTSLVTPRGTLAPVETTSPVNKGVNVVNSTPPPTVAELTKVAMPAAGIPKTGLLNTEEQKKKQAANIPYMMGGLGKFG